MRKPRATAKARRNHAGEGSIKRWTDRHGVEWWRARVTLGRNADGEPVRATKLFALGELAAAQAWKTEQLAKVHAGEANVERGTTVGELLDAWIADRRLTLKRASIDSYRKIVGPGRYIDGLRAERIERVTAAKVATVTTALRDAGTTSIAWEVHQRLKTFFRWCVAKHAINVSPLRDAKPPVHHPREIAFLRPEEVASLLAASRGHRFGVAVFLGVGCGMRTEEIHGLRWSDLDLDNATVRISRVRVQVIPTPEEKSERATKWIIETPKTKASRRTLPLAPEVVEALRAHRELQAAERAKLEAAGRKWTAGDYVVASATGAVPELSLFRTMLRKVLCKRAGIRTVSPHSLRHTFASLLIRARVDPKTTSRLLGHNDIETTLGIYVGVYEDMEREAVPSLAALLAPHPSRAVAALPPVTVSALPAGEIEETDEASNVVRIDRPRRRKTA